MATGQAALCQAEAAPQVRIQDPFAVVGELAKKDQNNSLQRFRRQKVIMPYATMADIFRTRVLTWVWARSATSS
jgi:hypothetical protein